ncbi:hypothetical protein HGRIS_013822 [Hohenbuehelia grisea]|uniref:Uncharacterized protein n=1 Tax=Hohenbuehelia grisea TaxID=104357 RepID=A0ABR3IWX5_9AGAR
MPKASRDHLTCLWIPTPRRASAPKGLKSPSSSSGNTPVSAMQLKQMKKNADLVTKDFLPDGVLNMPSQFTHQLLSSRAPRSPLNPRFRSTSQGSPPPIPSRPNRDSLPDYQEKKRNNIAEFQRAFVPLVDRHFRDAVSLGMPSTTGTPYASNDLIANTKTDLFQRLFSYMRQLQGPSRTITSCYVRGFSVRTMPYPGVTSVTIDAPKVYDALATGDAIWLRGNLPEPPVFGVIEEADSAPLASGTRQYVTILADQAMQARRSTAWTIERLFSFITFAEEFHAVRSLETHPSKDCILGCQALPIPHKCDDKETLRTQEWYGLDATQARALTSLLKTNGIKILATSTATPGSVDSLVLKLAKAVLDKRLRSVTDNLKAKPARKVMICSYDSQVLDRLSGSLQQLFSLSPQTYLVMSIGQLNKADEKPRSTHLTSLVGDRSVNLLNQADVIFSRLGEGFLDLSAACVFDLIVILGAETLNVAQTLIPFVNTGCSSIVLVGAQDTSPHSSASHSYFRNLCNVHADSVIHV